jgi:hypothetical protein
LFFYISTSQKKIRHTIRGFGTRSSFKSDTKNCNSAENMRARETLIKRFFIHSKRSAKGGRAQNKYTDANATDKAVTLVVGAVAIGTPHWTGQSSARIIEMPTNILSPAHTFTRKGWVVPVSWDFGTCVQSEASKTGTWNLTMGRIAHPV